MRNVVAFGLASCIGIVCLMTQLGASNPASETNSRKTARKDLKEMQGTWDRVSMELEGKEVPADTLKGWTATYKNDLLTLSSKDGVYRRILVTLDPSRKPKAMNSWDLEGPFEDQTVPGIYEIDGDTMKVCFAEPGHERPKEFTTKQGPGFLYCVYKRSKQP